MVTGHVAYRLSELDLRIVHAVPPGGNWRDLPDDVPSRRIAQIRASAARGEGSRSTYYGRLRWDAPSYTISTYFHRPGNGCTIHPEADRMLTLREAARLQTFPDDVDFHGPARAQQSQVGNAVPPLLAAQLGLLFPPGPAVDVFAGAGGLSLGLLAAGHRLIGAFDNDAHALATLRATHGNLGAARQVDVAADDGRAEIRAHVRNALGSERLALLAGGPPCQGFSTAGWCAPDDPRNDLLGNFVDLADALRPRHLLLENVTALLWRGRQQLDAALRRLSQLGYETRHAVLHAEAFGVPQRRRRLVVLATHRAPAPEWPKPWRQTIAPAYRRLQPAHADDGPPPHTVRDAIADLPITPGEPSVTTVPYARPATSPLQAWLRGELSLEDLLEGTAEPLAA
jgi:DNA (cytosine-5)-methyltransferase 1